MLKDEELKEFRSRLSAYDVSLGEKISDRLVRGIIIVRLVDYINSTSGIRSKIEEIFSLAALAINLPLQQKKT